MSAEEIFFNAYFSSFGAHALPAACILAGTIPLAWSLLSLWGYLKIAYDMPLWHFVTLEGLTIALFVLAAVMPIAWLLSCCAADAGSALYAYMVFKG